MSIETIGEIRFGYRGGGGEVAETVEVLLELRHAADLASLAGIEEPCEIVPRGVVNFGRYDGYFVRYGSGGKARAGKGEDEEEEDEEDGVTTAKRKHSYFRLLVILEFGPWDSKKRENNQLY